MLRVEAWASDKASNKINKIECSSITFVLCSSLVKCSTERVENRTSSNSISFKLFPSNYAMSDT